jgi:ankyrin repeat protein
MTEAEALVSAACSSDPRPAIALLATNPALSREGLACACVAGDAEYVARLLARSREAARDRVGPYGWEPILYATFSRLPRADPSRAPGARQVVRALLSAGADPNAAFDHEGWLQVPLYGAAGILNDAEITQMLLDSGADPNDNGSREVGEALYHGCEFPDPACAALLIDAGTHPEVVDYCLGRALNFPYVEMAQAFCAHGARASAGHLQQAVWRRRPLATVVALLEAGAPVDARGDDRSTALQVATRWGEADVVGLLRDRGADASAVTEADRALGAFVSGAHAPPPQADVVALDAMLFMAVQGGHTRTVERLLDAGARADGDPDTDGVPLGQAAWRRHPPIVRLLLTRGAELVFPGGGSAIGAALHGSRHCHHPEGGPTMQTVGEIPQAPYAEIVRILLDAGARVPERLWDGAPTPAAMIDELLESAS